MLQLVSQLKRASEDLVNISFFLMRRLVEGSWSSRWSVCRSHVRTTLHLVSRWSGLKSRPHRAHFLPLVLIQKSVKNFQRKSSTLAKEQSLWVSVSLGDAVEFPSL